MGLKDRQQATLKWVSGNADHPDVADGAEIKIFSSELREVFGKDINYIQRPKTSDQHFQGPETLAFDLLKEEHKWNVTGYAVGKEVSDDDLWSLPSGVRDSNNDGTVTGQNLQFNQYNPASASEDAYVFLGATKIKYDSETLRNPSGDVITRGVDYEIDYNRGRIQINDTANTVLSTGYDISYTYEGSNDNIVRLFKRMAQRGGNAILTYDKNTYTTDGTSEEGSQFMVQIDNVEWSSQPDQPDLVEVSIEMRVAFDRGT